MDMIENRTFEEIAIGEEASVSRVLSEKDIRLFAALTGDVNPLHVDKELTQDPSFQEMIANGMWGGALISAVLSTELPGPGAVLVSHELAFKKPIRPGEETRTSVKVIEKLDDRRLLMECICRASDGGVAIEGRATVVAPKHKVRRPRSGSASVELHRAGARLDVLIENAAQHGPIAMAVVHPVDGPSINGAIDAAERGLIEPVFVGPEKKIRTAAEQAGRDLSEYELVSTMHSHAAAARAVQLVRDGRVSSLMKGALHTDELMGAVLDSATGLRTERRASHVFAMDVPSYDRLLFITDAAINVAPNLAQLKDIVQNAIDLTHAIGMSEPRVALLSAVETVTATIPSTVDCAALCKMADRGQITGAIVDGPLAFDNAISEQAARIKGIESSVAGRADVLVVPDLVSGNLIAKQLDYLAGAEGAGIVVGAKAPIALTSRADTPLERVASAALAVLADLHRKEALS